MPAFDLLAEPWVPVLDAGRNLRDEPRAPVHTRVVGLREALARAHELREVVGDTPLETVALNRLLLALLADAHRLGAAPGPWWTLWDAGRADADALGGYLDEHAARFDLLHAERPFYGVPAGAHPARDETTLSQLRHAEAAGNNGTLFGHEMDDPPRPEGEPARRLGLAQAARSLLAYQTYGLGGLSGSARAGGRLPAFKHGALVGGAVFWLRGRSLLESLLLNAPPDAEVWKGFGEDRPAWRRDRPTASAARPPEGLLDLLTWQARQVSLVTEPGEGGAPVAVGVRIANGETVDAVGVPDPMMARVASEKKGVFPYGFRAERAVWRDLDALHQSASPEGENAPETFRALAALAEDDDDGRLPFGPGEAVPADVFGVENDKSKMLRWRQDRAPLYPALLGDAGRLAALREALADVQEQGGSVRLAARVVAEHLLAAPPPGSDERPNADKKAVTALAASLDAERRFWAAAEPPFLSFLSTLVSAEGSGARKAARLRFDEALFEVASRAFDAATSALDRSARHLRARAQGLRVLRPAQNLTEHREGEARAARRAA